MSVGPGLREIRVELFKRLSGLIPEIRRQVRRNHGCIDEAVVFDGFAPADRLSRVSRDGHRQSSGAGLIVKKVGVREVKILYCVEIEADSYLKHEVPCGIIPCSPVSTDGCRGAFERDLIHVTIDV